jgi:hypothetical protein
MKNQKENPKTQKQKVSQDAKVFALMLQKVTNEIKKQLKK